MTDDYNDFYSVATGFSFTGPAETTGWKLESFTIEKRWGDDPTAEPYEVIEGSGNQLMYGGASALWNLFTGGSVTPFNEANALIGVGDDTTDNDRTFTDLQASSNKEYAVMDSGYPLHTVGTGSANASIIYKATFGTTKANFDWNEWGLLNGSAGGFTLANRKVESLGTKTAASSWTLTAVISLS